MNLTDLRHRYRTWMQRLFGQLAVLFLAIVIVYAGMPVGQIHAHILGDSFHDHDTNHDHRSDQADDADHDHGPQDLSRSSFASADAAPAPSSTEPSVLHVHDTGVSVTALASITSVILPDSPQPPPTLGLAVELPPQADLAPPYKPPIT